MRVSSRKYIQRSNLRKNKYSKKIGGSKERNADVRQVYLNQCVEN